MSSPVRIISTWSSTDRHIAGTYPGETKPDVHVTVHDHTLIWLIEDITESRRDISEQAYWVTEEIGGSEDTVNLSDKLLLIVQDDSLLQGWDVESDIFE